MKDQGKISCNTQKKKKKRENIIPKLRKAHVKEKRMRPV